MILRKPYAFLIKYFRIIHLVLAFLVIYMVYKTTGIIGFFNNFANNGSIPINNLAVTYINLFMYGAIILILILAITIYFLMSTKEKKTTFYIFIIIYYILLFIMLSVAYSILSDIQTELITSQASRSYRDIALIIYLPQYFFVFYSLFRGIGFDIKKFNFGEDMEKLEIEEKDNEEVEVLIVTDTYKVKRKIRRFIREFKYYVRENTFIFCCLVVLTIVVIGTSLYFNRNVYRQVYKENQTFTYKSFSLTNLDSIITNLDYNGNILNPDKYYLVINLNVKTFASREIDTKDFRLIINDKIYYPTFSKREYFVDYGNPYSGEKLKSGMNNDYLFIFELDVALMQKEYRLRIVDNISYQIGAIVPTYKELIIRPKVVDKIIKGDTYNISDELNFNKTRLNDSSLKVNSFFFTDSYRYTYKYCYLETCTDLQTAISIDKVTTGTKVLMVLEYNLNLVDSYYKKNIRNDRYFFTNFVTVRYVLNGVTKVVNFTDKTPAEFTDKLLLQLDSEIQRASSIELLVTVRNQQYTIKLL